MIAKHVDINKATEFGKFIKEKTSYEFVYKSLAGIFNGVDPWIGSFDFSYVLENIDDTERTKWRRSLELIEHILMRLMKKNGMN